MSIELVHYIFQFDNHRDVDGLISYQTEIIDGRIITFRRDHLTIVPQHLEFNTAQLWVRIVGLPLGFFKLRMGA